MIPLAGDGGRAHHFPMSTAAAEKTPPARRKPTPDYILEDRGILRADVVRRMEDLDRRMAAGEVEMLTVEECAASLGIDLEAARERRRRRLQRRPQK